MTVPLAASTDPRARPITEYSVTTADQIRDAAARARRAGIGAYELLLPAESRLTQKDVMDAVAAGRQGSFRGIWLENMKCMCVRDT